MERLPELYQQSDGIYIVRIPMRFMPSGGRYIGLWQEYRFAGLKTSKEEKEKGVKE